MNDAFTISYADIESLGAKLDELAQHLSGSERVALGLLIERAVSASMVETADVRGYISSAFIPGGPPIHALLPGALGLRGAQTGGISAQGQGERRGIIVIGG